MCSKFLAQVSHGRDFVPEDLTINVASDVHQTKILTVKHLVYVLVYRAVGCSTHRRRFLCVM